MLNLSYWTMYMYDMSFVKCEYNKGVAMTLVEGIEMITYRLEALHGFVCILGSDGIGRERLCEVDEC